MKKLCTYLTLFVLGLLALAQPAAAKDYTFYADVSQVGWTDCWLYTFSEKGFNWTSLHGKNNPSTTKLSDGVYKFVLENQDSKGNIIFKNQEVWGGQQTANIEGDDVVDGCLYKISKNGDNIVYSKQTDYQEPASTDYTFYVDASAANWQNVYLRLWNGDAAWGNNSVRYLSPSETLSNGVKKFVVQGVNTTGEMMFRDINIDDNTKWDQGHETVDVSDPKNGALYKLGTQGDKQKWSLAVTEDYEEPAVKPVVTATPASCTFYGSQSVTLSADKDGAKIYYTTNGTEPSESNGTEYSASLSFTETTTLKAVAILDGVSSEVLTATYTKGTPSVSVTASSSTFETSLEVTITATPSDAKIYYTTDGTEPSTDGTSYDSPVKFTITSTTTVKAIAVINGVKSEKKEGTFTKKAPKVYIRGQFTTDNTTWGYDRDDDVTMTWNNEKGYYTYEASTSGLFMVSLTTGTNFWNGGRYEAASGGALTVPSSKPSSANIKRGGNVDFTLPGTGTICFDLAALKIWYEPKQETLPTELWVKGPAVGNWDTIKKMDSTGTDGEFSFTAIGNGEFVISTVSDASTFDNTAYGPATGSGVVLIAASPASTPVAHSHESGHNFRVPGAFKVVFNAKDMTIHYVDNTRTDVFVEDKTYYIDCRNISWFPGASAVVGIKWEGESTIHYGAEIVEVETDVYSFRAPRNMEYITIGRRTNDGKFYNERQVYVDTTKPGTNCIQVKEDNMSTSNVGYDWTNYISSSAAPLYILGSWLGDSWGGNTPIAMDYEPSTGVFSYVVTAAAGANNPVWFSISKSNTSFFDGKNEFQYESHPYIRFSEPEKANAKNQHEENRNFAIISAGTVKAKYDETDPTKLKVWYTPDDGRWPALYIIGANISDNGKDGQWKTRVQMTPSATQPGIYSYDLDELYCDLDYTASGEDAYGVTQNEKGHFNISFFPTYNSGDQQNDLNAFWKNSFIPDGGGMGMLNRDGVPFPFGFREEDASRTNWVSTNFVFNEKCTIYVDAVRQLVWVKVKTELSSNQVVFDFWDKGGSKYSEAEGYRWWNNKENYFAQSFLRDAEGNETDTYTLNFVTTETQKSDLNYSGPEQIFVDGNPDPVNVGQRYHFIASLPASYYQENGKVVEGKHIWIRIKKGASGTVSLERPYAYRATYTQGPNDDIAYNHYGNILYAGEPLVDMVPSVKMIPSDVEAPEHLGSTRSTQVMHYPYVNQFRTAITVNADGYPFYVKGVTEPYKHADGSLITEEEINKGYVFVEGDVFKPVYGAPVFSKRNQATLHYGEIVETQSGTTGLGYMTGVDHANADPDNDYLEVIVTYSSEGLNFSRTKKQMLFDETAAYDLLPTMRNTKESSDHTMGIYSFLGSSCENGGDYTLDLLFDQSFNFRDEMTGATGDNPRAAYVGYKINIDEAAQNDHSHVSDGNKHLAVTGAPFVWDFTDGKGTNIAAYDQDKWHYQAFLNKRLAVQLHHVLCAKTKEGLSGNITGNIEFHLFVPVATEFKFEGGTTGEAEEQAAKAMFRAPAYTEENPYRGPISADSYDSFAREINFNANAGNITTGVEGVGVDEAPVEFYNLQGVRMTSDTLAPGIYIRRQGNETSKVYIR